MINAIHTALSGLMAASKKIDASASNIANLQTAGSLSDPNKAEPYTPIETTQTAKSGLGGNNIGVKSEFTAKDPPFIPSYSPNSPFADENGIIGLPNVNLAEEAINIKLAETSFKANLKIIKIASDMTDELLDSFDREV